MRTYTEKDLILDDTYSFVEVGLMLRALNLERGPHAEEELMRVVGDAKLADLPLNVLLHALAEKESTFRPLVVGIEKDGTEAVGLFQFHKATAMPILAKLGYEWDEFVVSIDVQVATVVELLNQDLKRSKGDVKGAFRQFGSHTRRIIYPIIDCLLADKGTA